MANFKDMLKYLRSRDGYSQSELAKKIGVSKSTISMYEVGRRNPDFETLEVIADLFNVDMNFLLGKQGSENSAQLTSKDEKDIEKILEQTREKLMNQDGLMFDGDPATPEAVASILAAMRVGMEEAKQRNKEKYTPNKYRKD